MKVRKKPVMVEAVQWTGENIAEVRRELNVPDGSMFIRRRPSSEDGTLIICTLEGEMEAVVGSWIVRGVEGEFHAVKDAIFHKTYDPVEFGAESRE
jgi:hypothetical protein